jgi:hypothetical protein
MRSLVSVLTVAFALTLPASAAFARPADEPHGLAGGAQAVTADPSPVHVANGGGDPLGYIVVGLGGFAVGAAAAPYSRRGARSSSNPA